MEKKKGLSSEDMSNVIYDAIKDEKFIDKASMVSKIKAVISIFRFKQNEKSYNNLETPNRYSRALRENERLNIQVGYWKNKVKTLDPLNIESCYHEIDLIEIQKGFR